MSMRLSGALLLLTALAALSHSCHKNPLRSIEVTGTIFNRYTKKPLRSDVSMVTDSGKEKTVGLAVTTTDEQGRFTLKSPAARSGRYYIHYSGLVDYVAIPVAGSKTMLLDTLYTGFETFVYKISLLPEPGRCLRLYDGTIIPAETASPVVYSFIRFWPDTSGLSLTYSVGDCNAWQDWRTISFPLSRSGEDTIRRVLKY